MNTVPYVVLTARGRGARGSEALNVGLVLLTPEGPIVRFTADERRWRAVATLHPDYAAIPLDGRAEGIMRVLNAMPDAAKKPRLIQSALDLFARPFEVGSDGSAALDGDIEKTITALMVWLVDTPARTFEKERTEPTKRPTRLSREIRQWLQASKAYSSNTGDLSKSKVVSNYPIDAASDLYADFAFKNGKINAIETVDLQGVERLTPALRGDAAIKSITLEQASDVIDGKRIVVIRATDYGVARPVIRILERYADEILDVGSPKDCETLANTISRAIHRDQLPALTVLQD